MIVVVGFSIKEPVMTDGIEHEVVVAMALSKFVVPTEQYAETAVPSQSVTDVVYQQFILGLIMFV